MEISGGGPSVLPANRDPPTDEHRYLAQQLNNNNPGDVLATSQQKWKRFSEWMHCICVVTFDLELGQAMEVHFCH